MICVDMKCDVCGCGWSVMCVNVECDGVLTVETAIHILMEVW